MCPLLLLSVDTKPEYVRNRVSMISIGDGKDIADLQASFGRIAELCMHNSLRFKVSDAFKVIFSCTYHFFHSPFIFFCSLSILISHIY